MPLPRHAQQHINRLQPMHLQRSVAAVLEAAMGRAGTMSLHSGSELRSKDAFGSATLPLSAVQLTSRSRSRQSHACGSGRSAGGMAPGDGSISAWPSTTRSIVSGDTLHGPP